MVRLRCVIAAYAADDVRGACCRHWVTTAQPASMCAACQLRWRRMLACSRHVYAKGNMPFVTCNVLHVHQVAKVPKLSEVLLTAQTAIAEQTGIQITGHLSDCKCTSPPEVAQRCQLV
jgi:hypothetical protein